MRNAEALFLVHNGKPQIAELNILLYQPMCADHQIGNTALHLLQCCLLLFGSTEAGKQHHIDRELLKPTYSSLVMLHR